jgi:hypothetical protein
MKASLCALLVGGVAVFITGCGDGSSARALPAGTKPYPLKNCIVTDNDLGSMGEEQSFVYEGREVKLCCAPCRKKFDKNPAKFMTKIQ